MKGIVLVGNAPLRRNHSSLVDHADFVVRFNLPRTYSIESGTRFDAWVIANTGGGRRFVDRREFKNAVYKCKPSQLWFPRCVEVHKELRAQYPDSETLLTAVAETDISDEIIRATDLQQSKIVRFSARVYWRCLDILSRVATRHDPVRIPSAGFLTLYYVLNILEQRPVTLVGFTFEGWKGHPWHLERKIVRQWGAEGLLTFVPS
jgi:hypothetical protein